MSKPLHRGVSGARICEGGHDLDRTENGDLDDRDFSNHSDILCRFPFGLSSPKTTPSKYGCHENSFLSDSFIAGTLRSRHKLAKQILNFSIQMIVLVIIFGLFWWSVSISIKSRLHTVRSYDKIQEQVVLYLSEIGELALGPSRLKELEFCSQDIENHVPCFRVSDNPGSGYSDRYCAREPKQNCIVLPPVKYRIPLRWPSGRDVIWFANVRITAEEVLSSGSLTKRFVYINNSRLFSRYDRPPNINNSFVFTE